MTETTQKRELTPEEKFEVGRLALGQILLSNARSWEGFRSILQKEGMTKILDDVEAACKEMRDLLTLMDSQPVRPISQEDYDAKVAAGKKITFAHEGVRMKEKPEGET